MTTILKQFSTIYILCTITILVISCKNTSIKKLGKELHPIDTIHSTSKKIVFDLLVGTWKSDHGKNLEEWKKLAEGKYQSRVYSLKNSDTLLKEETTVYFENNKWIFSTLVNMQNKGESVKFTSILVTENSVQFSNPQHDFPTDINYTLPNINTLNAFIIGPNRNGGKDTIPFNYARIK